MVPALVPFVYLALHPRRAGAASAPGRRARTAAWVLTGGRATSAAGAIAVGLERGFARPAEIWHFSSGPACAPGRTTYDRNIFRYILQHSLRSQAIILTLTAVSFPFLYATLELPKRIINDALASGEARRPARPAVLAGRVPVPALRRLPGPGADQRRLQVRHQRLPGHHRRAHAAAAALRALLPHPALSAAAFPAHVVGRDRHDDHRRDRGDRRLHRRRLRPAGVPGRHADHDPGRSCSPRTRSWASRRSSSIRSRSTSFPSCSARSTRSASCGSVRSATCRNGSGKPSPACATSAPTTRPSTSARGSAAISA